MSPHSAASPTTVLQSPRCVPSGSYLQGRAAPSDGVLCGRTPGLRHIHREPWFTVAVSRRRTTQRCSHTHARSGFALSSLVPLPAPSSQEPVRRRTPPPTARSISPHVPLALPPSFFFFFSQADEHGFLPINLAPGTPVTQHRSVSRSFRLGPSVYLNLRVCVRVGCYLPLTEACLDSALWKRDDTGIDVIIIIIIVDILSGPA